MKLETNQIVDVVVKTERGGTFVATRKGKVLALLADRVQVVFADGEVRKIAYTRVRPASASCASDSRSWPSARAENSSGPAPTTSAPPEQ